MNNVLEAKLVCSNGLSLTLCSEWIAVFKEGNLSGIHQELKLLPCSAFRKLQCSIPHKRTEREYCAGVMTWIMKNAIYTG